MKPVQVYLALFNFVSASLWLNLLIEGGLHLVRGDSPSVFYSKIKFVLFVTQHLAVFEVLHSLLGMVSSPLLSTFLQVLSRVFMLDAFTLQAEQECGGSFSFYLMIVSWALAEVPRYSFYFVSLLLPPQKKVPYVLFFLRYSLFMVLYPTGITGELLQQVASYPYYHARQQSGMVRFSHLVIALVYLPLGPFMIFNMWNMRKRAMKKYFAVDKPSNGLVWPITKKQTGERSTTDTAKRIFAQAAREGAPVDGLGDAVAQRVEKEKNWRFGYTKHVKKHVELCLQDGVDTVQVARAGLKACYELFRYASNGDESQSFGDALLSSSSLKSFSTGVLKGEVNSQGCGALPIPYKGKKLEGQALQAQLDLWVKRGTIEDSAAEAIAQTCSREEWLDLSDVVFVMLGASSAMGPLQHLLAHRATVVAIDLPRPQVWEKLFRETLESNGGTLVYPFELQQGGKQFGCDMLADPKRICNWLEDVVTQPQFQGKQLVCGNYTYLDGALHVQLALAGDAIMQTLLKHQASLAFLCTPTDDHIVEQSSVVRFAQHKLREPKLWWQALFAQLGVLVPNYNDVGGGDYSVVDAIVTRQGPNYALAKRIQHWRALVARSEGHIVSSNIAPSTATQSVLSNPQFAAGYSGWRFFDPLEVFMQDTSGAVMFALLVGDLKNPSSKANPSVSLPHPLALFMYQSFHGGIWRAAYTVDSIGVPAAMTYYIPKFAGMGVGVLGVLLAAVRYVAVGI
ncbi:hypothetical protein BASA81_010578 [Batrachochytrium salamandrivorans]|nr:hypothetical protein BASA81_010578 [Batrachochytrium salamandrivorans]